MKEIDQMQLIFLIPTKKLGCLQPKPYLVTCMGQGLLKFILFILFIPFISYISFIGGGSIIFVHEGT